MPSAEMIKYASNAFMATKISFINEIANICERVGADVGTVASGMGYDPRIGAGFLRAGLGYGGSCFPKDTCSLVNIAGNVNYDFKLLKSVVEINQMQRLLPIERLLYWFGDLSGKTIVLLGLAFKPGTDDTRESPAFELASRLKGMGAEIKATDPIVHRLPAGQDIITVIPDPYDALRGADAAILITEWEQFIKLDWNYAASIMRSQYVFDGRNVLNRRELMNAGMTVANFGSNSPNLLVR
ncbi:MAG: hypothetical protein A2189_02140 [Paenibacillus sp. RIFOXYA1_FULL_44_5]|nr:MAG: hypothetical protein A2189_02140 [Paenibacillus sp. RIFOXYA1_FULL_44_5]